MRRMSRLFRPRTPRELAHVVRPRAHRMMAIPYMASACGQYLALLPTGARVIVPHLAGVMQHAADLGRIAVRVA